MKTLLVLIFISLGISAYSQTYVKSDIVGSWKVVKCELFLDNNLIKTSFVKNNSSKFDTVISGQDLGPMNEKLNFLVKSMIGTIMNFKDDNICSWNIKIFDLGFTNKYFELSKTNEINIGELKNNKKDLSYMQLKVDKIENDNTIFISKDSGMEFRYYVNRQK